MPLREVLRNLAEQSKLSDPDKKGINFLINTNPADGGRGGATGTPVDQVIINLKFNDVRLADLLDAILVVADHPIKYDVTDYGVVFSSRNPSEPQLYMRMFRVDPKTFYAASVGSTNTPGELASKVSVAARTFFTTLGVNMLVPPGKSVYFNETRGLLFVRATEQDLDTIERAIDALNQAAPEVQIKARFLEVPEGGFDEVEKYLIQTNTALGNWVGFLASEQITDAWPMLETERGAQNLGEPMAVMASGRQTQMRANQIIAVTISNHTQQIDSGPDLGVVPYVLADGYTINLTLIPSLTGFEGYATPPPIPNLSGVAFVGLPVVLQQLRMGKVVTTVNVWDNQTVVLSGSINSPPLTTTAKVPLLGDLPVVGTLFTSGSSATNTIRRNFIIFVTATIVDHSGKRVHTDEELPFAQDAVPTQPAVPPQPRN